MEGGVAAPRLQKQESRKLHEHRIGGTIGLISINFCTLSDLSDVRDVAQQYLEYPNT